MLDGADVRSLSLNRLRNKFGFVGQESILFDTTIAENIGLGKDEATLEEIKQAAKDANIHEFVSTSLPDGYDTNVGKHYIYIHTYVRRFDLRRIALTCSSAGLPSPAPVWSMEAKTICHTACLGPGGIILFAIS